MENYIKEVTGKSICRKIYDREDRTWANLCFPEDTTKRYENGKTFYNRDDKCDERDEKYLQVGGRGDCLMM